MSQFGKSASKKRLLMYNMCKQNKGLTIGAMNACLRPQTVACQHVKFPPRFNFYFTFGCYFLNTEQGVCCGRNDND